MKITLSALETELTDSMPAKCALCHERFPEMGTYYDIDFKVFTIAICIPCGDEREATDD